MMAMILTGVSHDAGKTADNPSTILPGLSSSTSSTSKGINRGTGTLISAAKIAIIFALSNRFLCCFIMVKMFCHEYACGVSV